MFQDYLAAKSDFVGARCDPNPYAGVTTVFTADGVSYMDIEQGPLGMYS